MEPLEPLLGKLAQYMRRPALEAQFAAHIELAGADPQQAGRAAPALLGWLDFVRLMQATIDNMATRSSRDYWSHALAGHLARGVEWARLAQVADEAFGAREAVDARGRARRVADLFLAHVAGHVAALRRARGEQPFSHSVRLDEIYDAGAALHVFGALCYGQMPDRPSD